MLAGLLACVILSSAYRLLLRSINDLMDAALPEAEQRAIEEVIHRHRFVVDHRDLRTRRSGSQRQIDFTILACRHLPLGDAHDLVDHVEKEIEATIPGGRGARRAGDAGLPRGRARCSLGAPHAPSRP